MIDAHIHCGDPHPALLAMLEELDLQLLNICVAQDDRGAWRTQAAQYRQRTEEHPTRFAWCTSFDLPNADDLSNPDDYAQRVIDGLAQDFAAGAIACKIWKNIGMEVKEPGGRFVMVDDPIFEPILKYLADTGRPLLTHIAEPLECWQPLREGSPHYSYYSRNPQWHMYNRPDFPSHEALMAARDRVLANHPTLRLVGAHLGSLEYDTDEVAARLDRYPNFAVDISARLTDLAVQDAAKVRQFFLDYPERILFGTDIVMRHDLGRLDTDERTAILDGMRQNYQMHRNYLESDGMVEVRGRTVRGLGLPAGVLERVYVQNARAWYPGL